MSDSPKPIWRTFLVWFLACVVGEVAAFGILLLVVERNLVAGGSGEGVPSWLVFGFVGVVLFTAVLTLGMVLAARGVPVDE